MGFTLKKAAWCITLETETLSHSFLIFPNSTKPPANIKVWMMTSLTRTIKLRQKYFQITVIVGYKPYSHTQQIVSDLNQFHQIQTLFLLI